MHLMNIDEKLYANSFGLAKQFSLNNGRRFPLTKVVKLCSEVNKRKNEKIHVLVTLTKT